MAKVKQSKQSKSETKKTRSQTSAPMFEFPLGKTNYLILAAGILFIIVGYIFMALPDDPDDFLTITLAPIILVFSFVVVIPFGLMYREKGTNEN